MTFPVNDAIHNCELAAAVYLDWPACERRVRALGYDRFASFDRGSSEAFVAANQHTIVYSLRGTDEIADWLKNVQFRMRTVRGRQAVHRGFCAAVAEIGAAVQCQLIEWWKPGMRVVGVGHSLGGAANVLFSSTLAAGLDPEVWTFGAPRVGNRHFAREYDYVHGGRTWRVVNENDAVPRVPGKLMGYRHVGRMAYIDWRGRLFEDPGVIRRGWNQVIGRAAAYFGRKDPVDGITRHLMHGSYGYLKSLMGLAK